MNISPFTGSRTLAVLVGAGALAVAGTTGAVASSLVTSNDIANHTIQSKDMANDSVTHRVIQDGAVRSKDLSDSLWARVREGGPQGPAGDQGPQGPQGDQGPAGPPAEYDGPDWSIVDRNVKGNGDAFLRSGPSAAPDVAPPSGVGSLGIRTGSGDDEAAFGNQVDFAGDLLSDISTVKYWVFATGEDLQIAADNLPSVQFEIDPNTARNYSTLLYVPRSADANAWTKIDASTDQNWYFTGALGTDTGCNQTTYCTLAEAEAHVPAATLMSVQIDKGRDYAFSGAVDDLQIGTKVYDFEPLGVTGSNVNN